MEPVNKRIGKDVRVVLVLNGLIWVPTELTGGTGYLMRKGKHKGRYCFVL